MVTVMSQDVSTNLELFELPRPRTAPEDRPEASRYGSKGEQTRAVIVEAALRLFREHGFQATTMRAIAREAGVATGNAYYYFGSKEELIRELYTGIQADHGRACRPVLDTETRLGPRIRGVLRAQIEVQAPYHGFAVRLYSRGAEPSSPLNPFSPASASARASAISLYAEAICGARGRIPAGLRDRLPELLWLYSLGVMAFWAHDTSPGWEKTFRFIDATVPVAERLIRLARLPVLRSLTRQLLDVLDGVLR
jgi:AcrR family transcriptional regulator